MKKRTIESAKKKLGGTITWVFVLILIGIALGLYLTGRGDRSPQPSRITLSHISVAEILRAPTCAVPIVVISMIAVVFASIHSYYKIQQLEAERRIQAAEAAEREEMVQARHIETQRRRLELNDLTINLVTGEEIARLMEGPNGEPVLVRPGLATKPVSRLDPDEVQEEPAQVRVAAMLANAARYSRGPGYGGAPGGSNLSLEMAALAMLNGGGSPERRLPGKIRILQEDELQMLEDKRNE
jgi:hypothetical protein